MGGPGQLFTYKELKSRNAKQGAALKRRAARAIAGAVAADIARVIIVTRQDAPRKTRKGSKKRSPRR